MNVDSVADQLRNAVIVLRCRADQAGGTVPQNVILVDKGLNLVKVIS